MIEKRFYSVKLKYHLSLPTKFWPIFLSSLIDNEFIIFITTIKQTKQYFLGKISKVERTRQTNTTKIFVFFFNIKLETNRNNKNN
jgi:hypothetical protein